jgi:hypothetical protein
LIRTPIRLLTLALSLAQASAAQPPPAPTARVTIVGRILDQAYAKPLDGRAQLPNALVASTDSLGKFRLLTSLAAGRYELRVMALGYFPVSVPIDVPPAGDSILLGDIHLRRYEGPIIADRFPDCRVTKSPPRRTKRPNEVEWVDTLKNSAGAPRYRICRVMIG